MEVGRDHHLVITQVYTGHGGLHVAEASEPRLDQGAGELRLDSEFVLPEVEVEELVRQDGHRVSSDSPDCSPRVLTITLLDEASVLILKTSCCFVLTQPQS